MKMDCKIESQHILNHCLVHVADVLQAPVRQPESSAIFRAASIVAP
jgi:hypothetical protein